MSWDLSDTEAARRDTLIDQLRRHNIHYLGGGSAWSNRQPIDQAPQSIPIAELLDALVRSDDARLRTAVVALLLRHPEHAAAARNLALSAPHPDRTTQFMAASILAAAALQRMWAFSFDLYLPGWIPVDPAPLVDSFGVPPPEEDYGRATLTALETLLQADDPFPIAYRAAWEDVARHVLEELREENYHGAA